ncbi:MAG: ABC transporter ATP-binding protein [Nitrospiraceae bacterium]|nr:ABC transporter ATP-binding protein [Nitrospiraceae bacterium]
MSSASKPMILELIDACFSYGKNGHVVDNLAFSVGEGEFIGLLGANGSGKSTILKLGSGILKPSAGKIMLWGKQLQSYRNKDRAKLISYLPQTLDISVPFTIRELVGMGLYPYDIPPAITPDEALDMVGLTDKADAHITDLSGGEKRRTFIAMTLLQGAGLLLLDEPLANLDIKYQIELVRLLRTLRGQRNISVVMALHDINIGLQFDKVMLIKNGGILGFGRPEDVLTESSITDAFDIEVKILRQTDGKAYVSYQENYRKWQGMQK